MSYRVGTTHYNLPQTEGSDNRDWFDTNEAFAAIDAAIYSAEQSAEHGSESIETLQTDVQNLKDKDVELKGEIDALDTRAGDDELRITRLENDVVDNKQDLKDAICSIEEASATAAYAHASGEFFWYNDTLYKATTNIAVGQQIVPDTNCKTTNITTELLEGSSGGVEIDDTVVSATKVWSSYKTNEELKPKTGDTRYYSGKIQYYTGSTWADVQIGGAMILDFSNEQSLSTTAYVTPADGAILGIGFSTSDSGGAHLRCDGEDILYVSATRENICIHGIPAGSSLVLSGSITTNSRLLFVPYK